MVKPDVVEQALYGGIISQVLRNRFVVVNLKMFEFDREAAERFYEVHRERDFFPELIDYITSGPVVALEIEGDGVVERIRAFIGTTDPSKADAGTIRYMYGSSIQNNAVHASDSAESAKKELAIVFGGS
jgi:nucleoside-diphosphate kinase